MRGGYVLCQSRPCRLSSLIQELLRPGRVVTGKFQVYSRLKLGPGVRFIVFAEQCQSKVVVVQRIVRLFVDTFAEERHGQRITLALVVYPGQRVRDFVHIRRELFGFLRQGQGLVQFGSLFRINPGEVPRGCGEVRICCDSLLVVLAGCVQISFARYRFPTIVCTPASFGCISSAF